MVFSVSGAAVVPVTVTSRSPGVEVREFSGECVCVCVVMETSVSQTNKQWCAVTPSRLLFSTDAELSCEFKTENDENPRIEWKKVDKDVSFVYFNNSFIGNQCLWPIKWEMKLVTA